MALTTAVLAAAAIGVIEFVHSAKHPFDPATGFRGAVTDAAVPIAFAAFALGASLLGADYTSRALTTLLTWEPRRWRVLGARAVACAIGATALAVAALTALGLALVPSAGFHATTAAVTTSSVVSTIATALRCAALAGVAAVAGVSAASLGRATAPAIAGLLAYLLVVEQVTLTFLPGVGRWLVVTAAVSWIGVARAGGSSVRGHTMPVAGLILAGGAGMLFSVALVVFQRRDVG